MNSPAFVAALVCYGASLISLYKGFHKMLAYANSDSILDEPVNAYVGGDAYNYIINSNFTTAFFVLALIFAFAGFVIQWNYAQYMQISTKK